LLPSGTSGASFGKGVLLSFFQKGRPPELLSERASFASFGKRQR